MVNLSVSALEIFENELSAILVKEELFETISIVSVPAPRSNLSAFVKCDPSILTVSFAEPPIIVILEFVVIEDISIETEFDKALALIVVNPAVLNSSPKVRDWAEFTESFNSSTLDTLVKSASTKLSAVVMISNVSVFDPPSMLSSFVRSVPFI